MVAGIGELPTSWSETPTISETDTVEQEAQYLWKSEVRGMSLLGMYRDH